jgi:hypothetical protein
MNAAMKRTSWIAAYLMLAASAFGQEEAAGSVENAESLICQKAATENCSPTGSPVCTQAQPTCQPYVYKPAKCGNVQEPQTPPIGAYNAPAEINVGIMGEWDFFASASFLYWQAQQDNMEMARVGSQSVITLLSPGTSDHGDLIEMDFDYKPAFKVGLGMNFRNDDWTGFIEYTRFRGKNYVNAGVPNTNPTIYNLWGNDSVAASLLGTPVFNAMHSDFHTNLDFIDGQLSRMYFVGQRLVFNSVFGLRFAWISESLRAHYSYNGAFINNTSAKVIALPGTLDAIARTKSWGIGPRLGLEMDWLLRGGIRMFGSGFADILYTSYKIQTKSATMPYTSLLAPLTTGNSVTTTNRDDDLGALRAHLDFEVGAGWGKYLDYNNWHFDLSAAYGFQVFFNQNVLNLPGYSPSNLYIQGLTVTTRLDF